MALFTNEKAITLGTLEVPPFAVSEGEIFVFDWPHQMEGEEVRQFFKVLQKNADGTGLTVNARIGLTHPFLKMPRRQYIDKIPGILDLINEISGHAKDRLYEAYLKKQQVVEMPGTECALLSLHLVSFESRVILFSDAGLDPLGSIEVIKYVLKKAKQGFGFLFMRFPILPNKGFFTKGSTQDSVFEKYGIVLLDPFLKDSSNVVRVYPYPLSPLENKR